VSPSDSGVGTALSVGLVEAILSNSLRGTMIAIGGSDDAASDENVSQASGSVVISSRTLNLDDRYEDH
jgi:hypothetical protein